MPMRVRPMKHSNVFLLAISVWVGHNLVTLNVVVVGMVCSAMPVPQAGEVEKGNLVLTAARLVSFLGCPSVLFLHLLGLERFTLLLLERRIHLLRRLQ